MPWVVTGTCNHCGICCKREGGIIVENPMIELHEDRCKFYTDDIDETMSKYGHCLIMQANMVYPKVRDRYGNKMTDEQIAWFEHNCPGWPQDTRRLQELIDGLWAIPEYCNFKFEEVP